MRHSTPAPAPSAVAMYRPSRATRDFEPKSIRPALAEIERLAVTLAVLFKPQLLPSDVVIAVQSRGRRRDTLGWFSCERWSTADGARLHEMTLCSESLGRGAEHAAETLLHEMVHFANYAAGVRDTSSNGYHNGSFKERAESVGLDFAPVRHPTKGWALPRLGEAARSAIAAAGPDPEAFSIFRLAEADPAKQARRSLASWGCGRPFDDCCPPVWVAAGSECPAACRVCGRDFMRR